MHQKIKLSRNTRICVHGILNTKNMFPNIYILLLEMKVRIVKCICQDLRVKVDEHLL